MSWGWTCAAAPASLIELGLDRRSRSGLTARAPLQKRFEGGV